MKNKHTKKHNFDCVVNLMRMTEREHRIYSNSSVIISKQFDIKIKDNYLQIGDTKQYSKNNTFTISFKKKMNEFLLENTTEKSASMPLKTGFKCDFKTKSTAPKTLNTYINDAWRDCKREHLAENKIGDFVMAKMKTYSAWPGQVRGFTKDRKRVQIYFFGTNNIGSVDAKEIVAFDKCERVIRLLLLRMTGPFHKGILEIEVLLGISSEHSLLKERNALA